MPYINPGRFIEPYLRPLGKQTIKQIPQIQQGQRERERLEALKPMWAEQVAESQANREIQRDAQARQMELLGLAATNPEAFAKLVPPGTDPETLLELRFSGAMGPLQAQYPKAHTQSWKKVQVRNEQGQIVDKWVDVAAEQAQGQEYPVLSREVTVNGKKMMVRNEVADRIEAMDREELRKDEEFQREQDEKAKNQRVEYLQKKVEWAIAVKSPEMLKYYNG